MKAITNDEFTTAYHYEQVRLNDAVRFFNSIANAEDWGAAFKGVISPKEWRPRTPEAKRMVKVFNAFRSAYNSVAEFWVIEPNADFANLAMRDVDEHFLKQYVMACAFRAFLIFNVTTPTISWYDIATEGGDCVTLV